MARIGGGATRLAVAVVAAALAIAGLTACSANTSSQPDPGFVGRWVLSSGRDSTGMLRQNGHIFSLQVGEATGGQMACQNYDATLSGSAASTGSVVFVQAESVGMVRQCDDDQAGAIDHRYLQALRSSTFATVEGKTMTLSSAHSKLYFTKQADPRRPTLASTYWRLKTFAGTPVDEVSGSGRAPFVLRFPDNSSLQGGSECMQIQAQVERFPAVSHIATYAIGYATRQCPHLDLAIGDRVVQVLTGGFVPSIDYDTGTGTSTLTLTNTTSAAVAVFVADTTPR